MPSHTATGRASGRSILLCLLAAVLLLGALPALPAAATFSGTNGRIWFFDEADDYTGKTVLADGSGLATLGYAQDVAYSSNGSKIAFRYSSSLYTANADGTGVTPLTTHAETDFFSDKTPVWTANDTKIVFVRSDWDASEHDTQLFVVDADGANLTPISPAPPADWTVDRDTSPAVSPDGNRIAFVREMAGPDFEYENNLMLVDINGANPTTVNITGASWPRNPSWSPGGASLTVDGDGDHGRRIYTVPSTGGTATELSSGTWDTDPVWSPDGTKIAYLSEDVEQFTSSLVVSAANGTNPQTLSAAGTYPMSPEWQACATTCPTLNYDADGDGTSNLDEHFIGGGGDPGDGDPGDGEQASTACTTDPLTEVQGGLQNMGFESGELAPWREGTMTEGVAVTGEDTFASTTVDPWEGSKMLRLGSTHADSQSRQTPGRNEVCQDFVVDNATERFAFNIYTYDYSGFDELQFNVKVREPDTGEVLASYRQQAWGPGSDTSLKTTGWRGVTLDLTGHVGEKVRLQISAGGSEDNLYGFWAYFDSADTKMPPAVLSGADVKTSTGSVYTDPNTGKVTITMPEGDTSPLMLSASPSCDSGTLDTSSVTMQLGTASFAMSPVTAGSGVYTVTIPASSLQDGTLRMTFLCSGALNIKEIGELDLYDPSGYITDAVSKKPVVGAEVTLYKVDGWTAGDDCEIDKETWTQPAPAEGGVKVSPYSAEISPNVNPQKTNNVGYYGWDVATGCWYIEVAHPHYQPVTSPVVGVPPEVTNLHIEMTPIVYPRKVSVRVPSKVTTRTSGQQFDLAGAVTVADTAAPASCKSGATVRITKNNVVVKTVTTAANGTYKTKVPATTNGTYRAVAPAGGHCAAATSGKLGLSVAKAVTLTASSLKVAKGKKVTLTAKALPAKKGETLTLLKQTKKGLSKLTTATTNKKGVATFTRTMKAKTVFVVRTAATKAYVSATSAPVTVAVKR